MKGETHMTDITLSNKEVKKMNDNKKPSEPLEPERWAMKERPPFNGRSKLAEKTLQEE